MKTKQKKNFCIILIEGKMLFYIRITKKLSDDDHFHIIRLQEVSLKSFCDVLDSGANLNRAAQKRGAILNHTIF